MKTLLALTLVIMCAMPAWAATPYIDQTQAAGQVEREFSLILDLWRDGRLDEVYGRTVPSSTTKEKFIRTLGNASHRPACCWEKLQEVQVTIDGTTSARIHARVGLESSAGGTDYATRSFKVLNEGSGWKVQAADLVSLAGTAGDVPRVRKKAGNKR